MKLIFGMITQFLAAASLNFTSPEMIKKMMIDERVLLNCMDCSYTQNSSINLYITIHITLTSLMLLHFPNSLFDRYAVHENL